MKLNTIYLGNNLEILKTFPDNSVDCVVTDPPYGLGKEPEVTKVLKEWLDKGYYEVSGKGFMGKEWDAFVPQPILWKEVFRVLKHGGYLLSFSGTRTYDWIVMGLRIAGFEIRDMLGWLYGSGMPKGQNVSKAIDKHFGLEREVIGKSSYDMPSNKDTAKKLKELGDTSGYSFGHAVGAERIVADITKPNHPLAQEYDGWNTALKPSVEPIVMARKPIKESTIAKNIIKYGTGAINIDGCRIATDELTPRNNKIGQNGVFNSGGGYIEPNPLGRYPANIIHDGSEEVEAIFPETESGKMLPTHNRTTDGSPNGIYGKFDKDFPLGETFGDSGSASRFFYCAKASQEERNFGLSGFKDVHPSEITGRKIGSAGAKNGGFAGMTETKRKNIHPTVKPIELMRYLVRLVTPKNGICLDPYLGSGTTAIACKLEKFNYVGIELMPEYVEIANARLKAHNIITYDIFDFI